MGSTRIVADRGETVFLPLFLIFPPYPSHFVCHSFQDNVDHVSPYIVILSNITPFLSLWLVFRNRFTRFRQVSLPQPLGFSIFCEFYILQSLFPYYESEASVLFFSLFFLSTLTSYSPYNFIFSHIFEPHDLELSPIETSLYHLMSIFHSWVNLINIHCDIGD